MIFSSRPWSYIFFFLLLLYFQASFIARGSHDILGRTVRDDRAFGRTIDVSTKDYYFVLRDRLQLRTFWWTVTRSETALPSPLSDLDVTVSTSFSYSNKDEKQQQNKGFPWSPESIITAVHSNSRLFYSSFSSRSFIIHTVLTGNLRVKQADGEGSH